MVGEKAHLEISRDLRRAITVDVGDQACGMREKISRVELENGGQPDLALRGIEPDVSCFSDEGACRRIELLVEFPRAERDARKPRAADHHAIEGEVDPLLSERANDFVFELVEGD